MNLPHGAHPLGLEPWYYRVDGQAHGPTIRQVLSPCSSRDRQLDRIGVGQWLRRCPDGQRTCFAAVRCVPAGALLVKQGEAFEVVTGEATHANAILDSSHSSPANSNRLLTAITNSLRHVLDRFQQPALALSGGLDSALLLALLRKLDGPPPRVYTLDAALPGYSEIGAVLATARGLAIPEQAIRVVRANEADFVNLLPATIRACETPLYNAHPVSKLLLARAMQADGIDAVITGDGADQVFAGVDGRDYLPIVGAIFRASGVALCTPLADNAVIALARQMPVDVNKTVLRTAAEGLLPPTCQARRKRPTLTPPLDIGPLVDHAAIGRLAAELDLPSPALASDAERMTWTTLSLLVDVMGGS